MIISNKESDDFLKIVKALEESGLLIKGVSGITKNKVKEQKAGLLSMLLNKWGARLQLDSNPQPLSS